MYKSCPIPTVKSFRENPSVKWGIIHPHQRVGYVGGAYRSNVRYTKKGVVNVVVGTRIIRL